jgi:hypothetical protein
MRGYSVLLFPVLLFPVLLFPKVLLPVCHLSLVIGYLAEVLNCDRIRPSKRLLHRR